MKWVIAIEKDIAYLQIQINWSNIPLSYFHHLKTYNPNEPSNVWGYLLTGWVFVLSGIKVVDPKKAKPIVRKGRKPQVLWTSTWLSLWHISIGERWPNCRVWHRQDHWCGSAFLLIALFSNTNRGSNPESDLVIHHTKMTAGLYVLRDCTKTGHPVGTGSVTSQ